ncbi:MAG: protein phosphatase 2C domain-containing protein [Deltaproteobacteria bacterium]|nr:protein phosphatase 2C domain-containing protein [Deltaproteobacteria bacterium]
MSTALPFLLSTASVTGSSHRERSRNNQDAVAVHTEPDLLVAVIADGCSSSPRAEAGAALGARWLASWVPTYLRYERDPHALVDQARAGLLEYLTAAVDGLQPQKRDRAKTIQELFLFTFLVGLVDAERALCFGLGDGVCAVNGTITVMDPGPGGAPPYLSYELIRPVLERDPGPLRPQLMHHAPAEELDSLLIASDGLLSLVPGEGEAKADELAQLWTGDVFARDERALGRYLSERAGRLADDTTAALFRRKP